MLLYKKGSPEAEIELPMEYSTRYGDLRSVEIEKLPIEKYEYNYRIAGTIVTDPTPAYLRTQNLGTGAGRRGCFARLYHIR